MAQTSTIYNFEIDLADSNRGVYEHLELRVARHPSESEDYLVTRVLAYCLEYTDGIAFSRGISDPDEPTIAVRDLTGAIGAWIEIGTPDASRVHKAGKAASRVAVYAHKDTTQMLRLWANERIHRIEALELYRLCLLYTSDAADERSSVDLGGRRIIKKKNTIKYMNKEPIQKE